MSYVEILLWRLLIALGLMGMAMLLSRRGRLGLEGELA